MTVCLHASPSARAAAQRIAWADVAAFHPQLTARGVTGVTFDDYVARLRATHDRRVHEGDVDHLISYLLQSTRFTKLPPIEPALSAKALVDGLDAAGRERFLQDGVAPPSAVPPPVTARMDVLLKALAQPTADARLLYFRELMTATFPQRADQEAGLTREYFRVMRFLYEKEFVAQRAPNAPEAVAELYRSRGLSTDTAVEAGYLVYVGLGVAKTLAPDARVRRVLIIGPGLDLAPRTALLEMGPPESYQPWAVIDAILSLGLARPDELEVVAADINARVVSHIKHARTAPPVLTLLSGIGDGNGVTLSSEYREYFAALGRSLVDADSADARVRSSATTTANGHIRKTIRVGPAAARALTGDTLDVVTDRFDGPAFDLAIATNILPYFNDVELMLAMSNVAAMLVPGGLLLHNEARPAMGEITTAAGLPLEQSRQAVIANVRGAPPLVDSVWLHRKSRLSALGSGLSGSLALSQPEPESLKPKAQSPKPKA
jgi:hypothetical protein